MEKFILFDLNKLTWQLIVATLGAAFSIFALIYEPEFIYYGMLTVGYGIIAHVIYLFWEWVFCFKNFDLKDKPAHFDPFYFVVHLTNLLLTIAWLLAIKVFYF